MPAFVNTLNRNTGRDAVGVRSVGIGAGQSLRGSGWRRPRFTHAAPLPSVVTASDHVDLYWIQHGDRGVVAEGPVGARFLGQSRLFRYEVRCWRGSLIPDVAAAVNGPIRVRSRTDAANQILELIPAFPICTWGRDELHAREMWNSNSLVSWLLARAGLWTTPIGPPPGGRAPGRDAGLVVASRAEEPSGP